MQSNKRKSEVLLCLFLLSVVSGIPFYTNNEHSVQESIIEIPNSQSEGDLQENAHVFIGSEGWISVYYHIEGNSISFADILVENIETLHPGLYNALSNVHWQFYPREEGDMSNNVYVDFEFYEDDLSIAQSYADWIMGFVNALSITNYEYTGNWIQNGVWNPFTQENVNLNHLTYEGFVPWPHMLEQFEVNIPRDQGGLASTINVSDCDGYSWDWWHWENGMNYNLGFDWWNNRIDKIEGEFQFDFMELLHVDSLIKPLGTEGRTFMSFELPGVENLQVTPIQANIENHTMNRDPWDLNYHYYVSLTLDDTLPSVNSFNVSFWYKFLPWDSRPRQEYELEINPYGYTYERLEITHENATLVPFEEYAYDFDGENIWDMEIDYFPEVYPNKDFNGELRYHFINASAGVPDGEEISWTYNTPHPWFIENVSAEFDNQGWTITDQWHNNGTYYNDGMVYPDIEYWFQFNHTYTAENWEYLWNSTEIYAISPMMQSPVLASANHLRERLYFSGRELRSSVKKLEWELNSLHEHIEDPEKMFDETSGSSHTIDIASKLQLPNITTHEDFLETRVRVKFPENVDFPDFNVIQPELSYGYGFWMNEGTNYNWYGPNTEINYVICTNEADYNDAGHSLPPNNLVVDFTYEFHPDTDDMIKPHGYIINEDPYAGENADLRAYAYDDTNPDWWAEDWYNATDHMYYKRFPSSGIDNSSMVLDLYYQDIPVENSEFHWGPFVPTYSYGEFISTLNTTELPDGYIWIEGEVADNAGNLNYFSGSIYIDNYDDYAYSAPDIALVEGSPANMSHIDGEVVFQFNMTDDTEVFAATATVGPQIYIGTSYLMEEVSPGIFEFRYNTQVEPENEDRWLVIQAYDLDGHQTEIIMQFKIDNLPAGNPPVVSIVSPTTGSIFNASTTPTVLFEVEATDDNGISSIQGQIDGRTSIDMIYNDATGYYEFTQDITNLLNGTHEFTVTVIDVDDADTSGGGDGQHSVSQSIEFTTFTEIDPSNFFAPEVQNIFPSNLTSATDIISGDLTFSLELRDDIGIEAVSVTLGTATDYTNISITPNPESVNFQNFQIVSGFPQNMDLIGTDEDGWATYEVSFDTTTTTNGFYIVYIEVGDSDPIQHQLEIHSIILINNEASENPFAEIPGFPIPLLLLGIATTSFMIYRKKMR